MGTTDHVLGLIRYRFVSTGLGQGMTIGEANLMAEHVMKNQGLFGFLGKMKVMGAPEGGVSTIMETFLKEWKRSLSESRELQSTPSDDPEWERIRVRLCIKVVDSIEARRSKHYPGANDYPHYIHDYMVYRIGLEVRQTHGIDPAEMGLDPTTIRAMSEMSYDYHRSLV